MAQLDPTFISQLLANPQQELAYLQSLPPEERKEVNRILLAESNRLLAQELVYNLNNNVLKDQTRT